MSLTGQTISHYEILERLGRGGMGEVYRARDVKLGRVVALKFLPGHLMADEQAKARLIQEAGAASALDHPNICTIHEIGDISDAGDGELYIAMTYYPGRTLRELLSGNGGEDWQRLPQETSLDIARQIAGGLAAAHRKGIVHRDVKPENIIVTDEQRAVLLDFGVAKLAGKTRLTQEGAAPGTIAYMSPEQARGEGVGPATDVWALGVVLYEMLTGRRPFKGEYDQAIVYSILNTDPDRPSEVEPRLWSVLETALAKDPESRWDSMQAFFEALAGLRVTGEEQPAARRRPARVIIATLAVTMTILTAILVVGRRGSGSRQETEEGFPSSLVRQFRQITFAAEVEEFPAFDPQGKRIAFSRETNDYRHIFIHDLESGAEVQLTGEARDDIQPAWSVDGRSIVFVRSNDPSGKIEPGDVYAAYLKGDIWKLEVESGVSRRIIDEGFNPSFSPDGTRIVFDADWAGPRRIWFADVEGRNPQQVTSDISEEVEHVSPSWSPDGRSIVFVKVQRTKFDVHVVNVDTREISVITDDVHTDVYPVFAGGRGIFFASNRAAGMNIWHVALGEDGSPRGEPRQISSGAGSDVQLALSRDGSKLAYSVLGINADLWRLPVDPATVRATGQPVPLVSTTREDSRASWSNDDSRIAFNSDRTGDMNIWVYDPASGSSVQITRGAGGDYQPRWSPDNDKLVFFSSRAGNADIWAVDIETKSLVQLTTNESLDINPEYSRDGGWIAFLSDRGGRREAWVMRADGTEQRQLTTIGASGHFLVWSRDGERVVFRSDYEGVPTAMTVPVGGGSSEPLVPVRGGSHMSWGPNYDLIADVTDHKVLWVTPLSGDTPRKIFEFVDLDVRVDYPVWSHDGRWIVFDRVKPSGGDVWVVDLRTGAPG